MSPIDHVDATTFDELARTAVSGLKDDRRFLRRCPLVAYHGTPMGAKKNPNPFQFMHLGHDWKSIAIFSAIARVKIPSYGLYFSETMKFDLLNTENNLIRPSASR